MNNQNYINNWLEGRLFRVLLAIIGAVFFILITRLLAMLTVGNDSSLISGLHRFFLVFGGGEMSALIKLVAYGTFLFGILDLREKDQHLQNEKQAFLTNVLPQKDNLVLSPQEVREIKLKVIKEEKNGVTYLVYSLIKKVANQFRNDQSIPDTMRVLDVFAETSKTVHEGELETIRFIVATVPMLGFVGTIVELAHSLSLVGQPDYMNKVSLSMASAFDATLVCLILTIILSFYYHQYIEELDKFFSKAKSFVQENLISRIFKNS